MSKKWNLLITAAAVLLALGFNNFRCVNEQTVAAEEQESAPDTAWLADTEVNLPVSTDLDVLNQENEKIELSEGTTEINKSGVYILSGKVEEGSVVVNVDPQEDDGTVYLVLDGVDIASARTAPLLVQEASAVVLVLPEGKDNAVRQAAIETEDEEFPSAALFSKADLLVAGAGSLEVSTEYNDGITSKDSLYIESGHITVHSAKDALVGKDALYVLGGELTVEAGKDGLKATNEEDSQSGNIFILGGTVNILNSDEGIEAININIRGGEINVKSSDDGINVKKQGGILLIQGGKILVDAAGDGIDSNGSIVMTDGEVLINTASVGQIDTPLDADFGIFISGGTVTDLSGQAIDTFAMGGMGRGPMGQGMPQGQMLPGMPQGKMLPEREGEGGRYGHHQEQQKKQDSQVESGQQTEDQSANETGTTNP